MPARALVLQQEEPEEPEEAVAAESAEEESLEHDESDEAETLKPVDGDNAAPAKKNGRGRYPIREDDGSPNATALFFRELSRNSKLLTPTEELAFGMVIVEAREKIEELEAELDILRAKRRKSRQDSIREELIYKIEAIEGGIVGIETDPKLQEALDAMRKGNTRLVVHIAKRYVGNFHTEPLMDLIQEGFFGLEEGIWRFDPRRGNRFSTYATWWIRHTIVRALADKGRTIRIPVHLVEFLYRMNIVMKKLMQELEREPNDAEVGRGLQVYEDETLKKSYEKRLFAYQKHGGVPPEPPKKKTVRERRQEAVRFSRKVKRVRAMHGIAFPMSLDMEVDKDGNGYGEGRTFIDIIPDRSPLSRPDVAMPVGNRRASVVHALLSTLKPMEREILVDRFLRVDTDPRTLDDDGTLSFDVLGEKLGYSRESIRQIQKKALEKLRRTLRRGQIKLGGRTLTVADVQVLRRAEAE